jgi:hypothetical protein
MQWGLWSDERRADAWCLHCRELLLDALTLPLGADEQQQIERAVLRRVLAIEPVRPFAFIRELAAARQAAMVAAVLAGRRDRVGSRTNADLT